jgi:hypothetical protein
LLAGMNDTPAGQGYMCFDNDESQDDNADEFVKVSKFIRCSEQINYTSYV